MSSLRHALDGSVRQVEEFKQLDAVAVPAQRLIRRAMPGRVEAVLGGEPIGHPLHPALVAVPIGAWLSGSVLDATGGSADAARRVIGFGVLSALPTAAAGAHDWAFLHPRHDDRARRLGLAHAVLNYAALGAYAASWNARRRDRRAAGALLALAGAAAVGASGWIGGHLTYRLGAGVEPTAQ